VCVDNGDDVEKSAQDEDGGVKEKLRNVSTTTLD
jgi:hypothetical protein